MVLQHAYYNIYADHALAHSLAGNAHKSQFSTNQLILNRIAHISSVNLA